MHSLLVQYDSFVKLSSVKFKRLKQKNMIERFTASKVINY